MMYVPPGSFKYTTPKPVKNGSVHSHSSEIDINCDRCTSCLCWSLSAPFFRLRFWTIVILIVLVVTTGHFYTVVMFRKTTEPVFLVKYDLPSKESNGIFKKTRAEPEIRTQTHHRKMTHLLPPADKPSSSDLGGGSPNSAHANAASADIKTTPPPSPSKDLKDPGRGSATKPSGKGVPTTSVLDPKSKGGKLVVPAVKGNKTPLRVGTREKVYNASDGEAADEAVSGLKLCPPIPPNLQGPVKVTLDRIPSLEVQGATHPELGPGGRFRPPECRARHKVAVIIPFRDRATHLAVFLYNVLPFLERQQIEFAIYIVEQAGGGKFNRAMLMNVGSIEALKQQDYQCFIFHDVDLIPEDDRNLYTCPEQPRHMSVAINNMKYRLPYNDIFGGVSAMTTSQFSSVNGFSNKFWGWGGEDDDMSNRIKFRGFFISRYPANVARYTMMHHKKDHPNPQRYKYLHEGKKRYSTDGLSNVKYKMLDIQLRKLYTWFYVELLKT